MTFSQYAGTAIVPTLARLVLAAAFISTGWNKVFKSAEFPADEATRLKAMGVELDPITPITAAGSRHDSPSIVLAAFVQDQDPGSDSAPGSLRSPPPPQTDPAGEAQPSNQPPPVNPTESGAAPSAASQPPASTSAAAAPLPPGNYRGKEMHRLMLLLDAKHFPQPRWMAMLAAYTELIGGAMLLIGLFSRVWGLGLAIAMGVAFYLTTMPQGIFHMYPWTFAEDLLHFQSAYLQVSLFVLAFGIFLTGPGPLSLDRILFGGSGEEPLEPGQVKVD